jgi:hypothetical protein
VTNEANIIQKRICHKAKEIEQWLKISEDCPSVLRDPWYQLSAICALAERVNYGHPDPKKAISHFKFLVDSRPDVLANAAWTKIQARLCELLPNQSHPELIGDIDDQKLELVMEVCGLDPQDFIDAAEKAFPDEKKSTKKTNKGAKK